ncbi:hypothetical protein NDU88_001043 [Pleurodeles waltl]|uniref:Uncharacterized protein n=1 Tax=Pleurodeles waltl TaxID=8319 RepID=A0AAV7USX9_PLEWA|nr:hypothetical protein NDU88_001043 [Pleurodeles waltl]
MPHATTGMTPSQLCFGRVMTNTIPHYPSCAIQLPPLSQSTRQKSHANIHASQWRRARVVPVQVGDTVLVKYRHPGGKFRLPFEVKPWTVTAVKGTMVTVSQGLKKVTRNISQFKRLSLIIPPGSKDGSSDTTGAQRDQEQVKALPDSPGKQVTPLPEELRQIGRGQDPCPHWR